jgi:Tannase and feruloyl esterase
MRSRFSLCSRVFSAFGVMVMGMVGLTLVPGGAAAEPAAPGSVIKPVVPCEQLVRSFDIPGARTTVTSATPETEKKPEAETKGEPAHCDVKGVIEPSAVHFQLRLPTTTYTGRYLQYGCGGLCGVISPTPFPNCGPSAGDAAVAATDDGHDGPDGLPPKFAVVDGSWAANNQAARNDWSYRAPHVLSLASKHIINAFYGAPPRHSYFSSCSNGGREALLLAQRYPKDFDGIIAGTPGAGYIAPLFGVYQAWLSRSNTGSDGASIITFERLPALHAAVVAACDRLDGLVDGQIDDPRACQFDPGTVQCAPGTDAPTCLAPAQVEAARKLYAGPTDANGHRLYPGGQSRGSELAWDLWIVPPSWVPPEVPPEQRPSWTMATLLAKNYLSFVGYPIGKAHSSLAEFQFTVGEFHRLQWEGVKSNAMSLDLREFQRSGGKLILWHGWGDPGIPPSSTLDYYQRLWQRSGGLRETQEWARLFMVPTMYHCDDGGYRLEAFDPVPELVAWVERGQAPERIIATGTKPAPRSRPVFPYPLRAQYDGNGSIDDASNFVPAQPTAPPRDTIDWVGTYLHDIPGPRA